MGKGADNFSKDKKMNDNFGYDPYGVRTICESYYELKEMGLSNWTSVEIMLDFDKAVSATIMTADMRVILGLVHGFGLTIIQASKLAKIKMSEAKEALDEAYEIIEACLNGYDTTFFHKTVASTATNLDEWLAGVRSGQTLAFDIPPAVMDNMFNYLVSIGDKKVLAILNPKPMEEEEDEEFGGYPFHNTSASIEDPNRKGNFNRFKDKDYFVAQDKRNNVVSLDGIKDPDALISLKTTGKRKSKGDGEDEETNVLKNGRSNIYEQY